MQSPFKSLNVADPSVRRSWEQRSKKVAPPPRNGSKYLLNPRGYRWRSEDSSWRFPPAHFRNGFVVGLGAVSMKSSVDLATFYSSLGLRQDFALVVHLGDFCWNRRRTDIHKPSERRRQRP